MFLRTSGKQILLLQSYRDGFGRARQRCLARFRSQQSMESHWQDLRRTEPQLRGQLESLKALASELVAGLPRDRQSIERKVARCSIQLMRLLSESDADVPELLVLKEKLDQVYCDARISKRPPKIRPTKRHPLLDYLLTPKSKVNVLSRNRMLASEMLNVPQYTESLENQARRHFAVREFDTSLVYWRDRAQVRPDLLGMTGYAMALTETGHLDEALEVLLKLPGYDSWVNLNLAAICLRQNNYSMALDRLLLALPKELDFLSALESISKGRNVLAGGEYWTRYGDLWDDHGRRFLKRLWKQPLVKLRLEAVRRGVRRRTLIHRHYQVRLLPRLLEAPNRGAREANSNSRPGSWFTED